ncbi:MULTISPECIES: TetR/AcrR family transcriptional regulator [Clostridium]|uniref:HTH-type transcriptional repressor KstR2 n=2 Tax=Clostridium TaxID=1485 RepID=D8GIE4_CLOLD|nr:MULTISPECIES: TetR/AcrR family transcriptional regulator [Clostridium]ADK17018.1 predicted transcriptional regulator [Clostridium ljungdahlii DSM 13528]AGY76059.1 TetR/AcrR family transcriptional regulator [Clostridium autoethanogenum DSM 10061]ALU36222.1 Transcriptional regulator TetR family [Clostridium autoethanogenum DSM 10061]OAA85215.1 HTH-type transcriptional repressor KstR2 [Clostridium ljungdahlii DSM 13528]OVY48783.1 HTH-type transcriptional repressor KstR2 [Clostridium autoethano
MKDKILDTAANKIQMHGLKKFTIDEIAKDLKISKKTIYKYFNSKDAIVEEFFKTVVESDKKNMENSLSHQNDFISKIHSIIYSNHKYKIPINLINEAKIYYPKEWGKIQELKQYKLGAIKKLLEEGVSSGVIRQDINLPILIKMLEQTADTFLDYNFLMDNKMKFSEAIQEVLKIILYGISIK